MDFTNYAENKLVDAIFRGQPLSAPATWYVGLSPDLRADTTPASEVSGGGYARVAVPATLAAWAGTQAAGSTVESTGTNATTSNNEIIAFPESTAAWATGAPLQSVQLWDADTGGNCWIVIDLAQSFTVPAAGVTLKFNPSTLSFQVDD